VTDLDGRRISFGVATGRFFGKFISAIMLWIGFIMAEFTSKKQALHDIMASCLVIKKRNPPRRPQRDDYEDDPPRRRSPKSRSADRRR
jgi:uncharacterized RDD family membrane protein YckC